MEREIWKDIPGYEGLYKASNTGRIASISDNRFYIKKQRLHEYGYLRVNLCNGKNTTHLVHRLIASAFWGDSNLYIDHINAVRDDNRLINLRRATVRQNNTYSALRMDKSSKFIGVSWHKLRDKWSSYISIDGKKKHLGYFDSEFKASFAYRKAFKQLADYDR